MEYRKLNDVANVIVGYPFKSECFNVMEDGIKLVRGKNIGKGFLHWEEDARWWSDFSINLDKYYLKNGDIVIGMDGSNVGKNFAVIQEKDLPLLLVQRVACVRAKENFSQDFLKYCVMNQNFTNYVEQVKTGSAIPHISASQIYDYRVPFFDLEIQEKIAKVLNCISDKIELNNQMNENLLGLGDIIYRETFVKEGLQKGWEICKLKDIAYNFDSKRRPMSSREREKRKGIYPYYGATSIIDYVDDYIFDGIYLLMGEDGTVVTNDGKPVLQYIWGKNWINNHAHVLSGNTISTEHLMFALRNCNVRDIITGAVQPKINQENMNNIKIVLADEATNINFEKIIDSLMKQYINNIEQNKRLEKIRDTLLPKLMNGEIDLDKIEI